MAEAEKETSSLVNPKEKKSPLDDVIGEEFLNSWKSVSATEDVTADFNFDSVPSGKKKKFNFGKLDMDFNLDADFDKFSSFKVDVPDLDFTNSPKKTAKAKEGSEEEPPKRSHQGQKDCFSFSFDFNELENFDFSSSLMSGEKSSKKNLQNKQVAVERKGLQGSQIHLDEGITNDNLTTELPASDIVATSNVGNLIGELGTQHSSNETCASESGAIENLVVFHGARTSTDESLTKNAEETEEQSQLPDKATLPEPNVEKILKIGSTNFVGQDDRDQNIVSDIQTEACSQGVKENTKSVGELNFSDKLTPAIGSNNEKSQSSAPPSYITGLGGVKYEGGESCSDIASKKLDEAKSAQGESNLCDTSIVNILMKKLDDNDINADLDIQSSAAKLPLIELERLEVNGSALQHPCLTSVEVYSHGSKPVSSIHISPIIEKGEGFHNVQMRRLLMGNSKSITKELKEGEPNMPASDKNNKKSSNISSGEDAVNVNAGCKLVHPGLQDKEEIKGESVAAEKHVKDHKSLGSEVSVTCSTENRTISHAQTSLNPKLVVTSTRKAIQNSNIISDEGLKAGKRTPGLASLKISSATCSTDETTKSKTKASISSRLVVSSAGLVQSSTMNSVEGIKAGNKTPDFSKISRTMAPKIGQSNSGVENEMNSISNSVKNMEVQGNTASRIPQPVHSSGRKMPPILSLKRKTFEASDAEFEPLKPLKRLSISPSISRNIKDPAKSVVDQASDAEFEPLKPIKRLSITPSISRNIKDPAKSVVDQISVLENVAESDHLTSGVEIPPVEMIQQEVSVVMEDDGKAGKAETYTRELEDICNMLKKKHEEAKEILVRAVVNNNNLLMLNHPIYEYKIGSIQKLAAQLMSKHLQMLKL